MANPEYAIQIVFIHIWTHFFVDVWQCTPDQTYTNNLILGMKHCYLDKFETISFSIGRANYCQQNLFNFEYWIVNNAVVRLEHFANLKLKCKSEKSVTYKALCDVSAYEAAGVETRLKKKQLTEEEWHTEMEKTCLKMIKEQKEKKKSIHHPPYPIPDSVLLKKHMKKDEREPQAKRKDALSKPPHFWKSFGSYVEN